MGGEPDGLHQVGGGKIPLYSIAFLQWCEREGFFLKPASMIILYSCLKQRVEMGLGRITSSEVCPMAYEACCNPHYLR
jgi:hypothetical protein